MTSESQKHRQNSARRSRVTRRNFAIERRHQSSAELAAEAWPAKRVRRNQSPPRATHHRLIDICLARPSSRLFRYDANFVGVFLMYVSLAHLNYNCNKNARGLEEI